jgi:hypothetical protein
VEDGGDGIGAGGGLLFSDAGAPISLDLVADAAGGAAESDPRRDGSARDADEHAEQATATGDPGCLDLRVHADELGAAQLAELSVLQAAHERAPLVRRELQNRPGPVLLGVPDGDDAGQIGCHLHTAHSRGGRSWFRIACRSMRPATSSSTSASVVFGRPESTTRA